MSFDVTPAISYAFCEARADRGKRGDVGFLIERYEVRRLGHAEDAHGLVGKFAGAVERHQQTAAAPSLISEQS